MAISLGNLGLCYYSLGRYEEAIAKHQQHHDISEEIGDRQGVAISLHNWGEALRKLEQFSEAENKVQQARQLFESMGSPNVANSFYVLADIAHQTQDFDLARHHCQEALTLSQQLGIPLAKDCEELLAKIQKNLS